MDRATAKKAYKETKRPMGVFRIRNKHTDTSYIGTSTNLVAIINRHKTELKFGSHRNAELLSAWRTLGEAQFSFEILDELDHRDQDEASPEEELKVLLEMWIGKLEANEERVVPI